MTIVIINSDQIFTACVGDSRVVISTAQGKGSFQTMCTELTKDQKAKVKEGLAEERLRVTKAGFTIRND